MPTQKDFLPPGITAVAPNGNVFYLSDIAKHKLKFVQLRPIKWGAYKATGEKLPSVTFPAGTITFPVANALYSKVRKKPIIELDSPDGKFTIWA